MSKGKKALSQDKKQKREAQNFNRKICNIFSSMGFSSIPVANVHFTLGFRDIELDSLYIFENIWLICEETCHKNTEKIRGHIRGKKETFQCIHDNFSQFHEFLCKKFPDKINLFKKYDVDRIKFSILYISKYEFVVNSDDSERYSECYIVQPKILGYFGWLAQNIKYSARNELFRYLGIRSRDIGSSRSFSDSAKFRAPILYPKSATGLKNGVGVVSFLMPAGELLNTCYVLRKDNWEESIFLYQRLIYKEKIKKIRSFLLQGRTSFYNNVIVSLPSTVRIFNEKNEVLDINRIDSFSEKCTLEIPLEINSIGVIDGQHRIYAHYEGPNQNEEKIIGTLRSNLHLLVTGLLFPNKMPEGEKVRIQSQIFLDINSNAKPVPQNILLHIKRLNLPLDSESIAQRVLEKLNQRNPFINCFQINELDIGKIKTASIIKFALKHLVTIKPTEGKKSLYSYWQGKKPELENNNDEMLEEYIDFCCETLSQYFSAIKSRFHDQWNNKDSKLLSVIAINAFVIAFTRHINISEPKDYDFYKKLFDSWEFSFRKEQFFYTSSQYSRLSTVILKEAFKLKEEELEIV